MTEKETIAVIDPGSGNLRSVARALEVAAGARGAVVVTTDPALVAGADRLVLPGQGAFAAVRNGLTAIPGMIEAITQAAITQKKPFLGICIGMQLMVEEGFEHGRHPGFGWLPGTVEKLAPGDPALKIPHMGWNRLALARPHPVLQGMDGAHVYFVHSYAVRPGDAGDLIASTDHGGPVAAAIGRDNLIGVQFHPEKSQGVGLALLERFVAWAP